MQGTPKRAGPGKLPKGRSPDNKFPPSPKLINSHQNYVSITPPRLLQQGSRRGDRAIMDRAEADAVFASTSSQWYAGAAFDRSPATHTLPRPTVLLSKSSRQGSEHQVFATSCPQMPPIPIRHVENSTLITSTRTGVTSPEVKRSGDLRIKSQNLLRMLKGGVLDDPSCVGKTESPMRSSGEELEEMTRQVRKLLNLPNKDQLI